MTSTRFSLVRGRAMRVTKTDACGNPVLGPDSVVVTEGFISVGLTANTETGDAISVTNAAGKVCILDTPAPKFTGYSITVAFCGVDPELFHMMTGQPVVLDAAGDLAVGLRVNSGIDLEGYGFAMELWSSVPVAACDDTGLASYGYFLLPFVKGGTLGDVSIENGAINFTLSGASTKDGSAWGVGPFNVVRDADGDAAPLNLAIDPEDHLHLEVTTVAPPTVFTDGAVALGVPATTATAGTPGTLSPANAYAPANFAGMTGLTASPTTAWTTGQRVVLRDGTSAHWTGTQWATGAA